jgi:hypothetical protein
LLVIFSGACMSFKSVLACAAGVASLLSAPVLAQETHIIKPAYPDSFNFTTTMVSDDIEEGMGEKQTKHIALGADATVTRKGDGFKAIYRISSFDMQSAGPDGKPQFTAMQMKLVEGMIKGIGVAEVTMDKDMRPISVDNIETIKATVNALADMSKGEDANELKIFQLMVKDMTPQSAAELISKGQKSASYFNRPLEMNKLVELPSETVEVMGAVLRTNSTMTLTGWEEGKTARLRFVMKPRDEDLKVFVSGILKAMVDQMPEKDEGTTKEMMGRMADHMEMTMIETCDVDVSLVNSIDTRATCDDAMKMKMDLKFIFPKDVLEKQPDTAANMPVITLTETSKKVVETMMTK